MKMTGEQLIAAPRDKVWAALNDPEVLRACIPGCQSLEKLEDDRLKAVAVVKVGPISAKFAGEVTLSDLDPPNGYRISGEGQGGAAGFAKGGANVRLADEGGATRLAYDVDAQVGGKLAQLGGGLIDATAKQMAGTFFKKFAEVVAPAAPEAPAAAPEPSPPATSVAATPATATSTSAAVAASPVASAPVAAPGLPVGGLLALAAAAVAGFLLGQWGDGSGTLSGLIVGLLVVLVAGAAYAYGKRVG